MRFACSLLVLTLLASGQTARAADTREQDAKLKCLAGDVSGGVALLAELYVATGNTTYLYNQARCYQQNNRPEEAIGRFREYLRKEANVAPDERQKVEGFIAELEHDRGGQRAVTPTPTPKPEIQAQPTVTPAPPGVPVTESSAADELPRSTRPLRIAAYAAGAAGVLMVAAGTYFAFRTKTLSDQADQNYNNKVRDDKLLADGHNAERWQWVGLGVGGALVAGGVVAFLLSRPEEAPSGQALMVFPVFTAQSAGAALHLRF